MERSETFRRTVGAACADASVFGAARTVSAGVNFCGKERGTPYYPAGGCAVGSVLPLNP
jgi:hypothetical protein